jgi:hypothetical protein
MARAQEEACETPYEGIEAAWRAFGASIFRSPSPNGSGGYYRFDSRGELCYNINIKIHRMWQRDAQAHAWRAPRREAGDSAG